ncbi:sulfatase, partial [bacterium]|nr:sulfatase [bacterium]
FPFAVALAWLVNRVILRDIHHLDPRSLVGDGIAALVAAGLAFLVARVVRVPGFTRRPAAAIALAAVCAAVLALPLFLADDGEPDPARPSVVLVSIDTLRPDRLGVGGCPRGTSPVIDRLCRESLFFPEALTVSPGSGASHAALLTSRYPISNGVHTNFSLSDESLTTWTELMRERGYRTGGFATNVYLSDRFGFPQGFGTYVQTGVVERLDEPSAVVLPRTLAVRALLEHVRGRFDVKRDPSFEAALGWIGESRRPMFLFLHLMDVHAPYVPPPPYDALFGATREGDDLWEGKENPYGWRRSEEAYLAEIRFADAKMGRWRRAMEEQGRLDEAIVVLTSDHGENLADHAPQFAHGNTLFDATVRILLAVRAPGRFAPGLDARVVENVDVLPTIAPMLGLAASADWEGRNLFFGRVPERPVTFAQLYRDFAVRTRDTKVILHEDGHRELLDLRADPGEQHPRPPTEAERELAEKRFAAWYAAHVTELYDRAGGEVSPESLSPETVETLRALGYLD